MKIALALIGTSTLTAFVAYQAGQWRQHDKDMKVFKKTMDACRAIVTATTMQEADDILTTFEMDLKQF